MLCFHTVFAWVSHDLEQYSHIIAKESEVIFYKLLMASSSWRWRYYAPPKYRSLRMFTIRHSITSENTRVFIWSAVWTSDLEKRPMFEYHRLKKKRLHTSPWNWPWRPRWGWWRYRTMPRSGHFIPGAETRHPLYRRLGGPQFQSGRVQKILTYPGYDSRIVQSVASQVSQDSQMELISISMLTSTNRVLGSGQERIQGSLLLTHCIQIESH